MKLLTKLLLLFFGFTAIYGQELTTAQIQTPEASGLHKIPLPHTLRSFANKDLRDLRILDANNNQAPYFIEKVKTTIQASDFRKFKIIESSKVKDTSSTYIFQNPEKKLDQVILQIANYEGFKYYDILGSDDKQQWFGVVNKQYLNQISNSTSTSTFKVINFPLCSYKFLKLIFNDKNSLPINVLAVGKSISQISTNTTEDLPAKTVEITSLKTEKKTKIRIAFTHPEIIDQIKFTVTAPAFYKRSALIYFLETVEIKNKETQQKQVLKHIVLNSETPNEFDLYGFFGKELFIEIKNEDNPELEIAKVNCFQNALYAIADLKGKEQYTLSVGDQLLSKPNYDIAYFKNKVASNLPVLTTTKINYPQKTIAPTKPVSFWQQAWFMWLAIGLAALLIVFVVSGLVKDMKQPEN